MEQDKAKDIDQNDEILDEVSEDELTDVELDPVSGGVKTKYIEMEPLFIQVKKPPTTIRH